MKQRGIFKSVGIFGMVLTLMLSLVLAWQSQSDAKACSYFKRVPIKKCAVSLEASEFEYTGAAITPAVKVEHNGVELTKDTDYTVAYSKNVAVGTAKVTVKGKGDYRGKKTLKFQIVEASVENEDNNNNEDSNNNDNNNEDNNTDNNEDNNVDTSVEVNIYTGNDNADGFVVNKKTVAEVTPENLIKELQNAGAVAQGVQVRGFRDMGAHLILDLSSEYAQDVCSSGTAGEYIKVGCVVNTFLDAYNKTEIMITVEDQPWESGHAMYDSTLTRFESNESSDVEVNIYTGNDNADGFVVNTKTVAEVTPENLIQELQNAGAVAQGVQVRGFRDMGTHLILDLSSEYAQDVSSSGSAGEYIKVGCVVNTFLDAYNKTEIMITVEDQPWESGHAIYDDTLTRFN